MIRWLLLPLLGAALVSAPLPQTAAPQVPSRASVLRGEYGRYRANNDLLYYHLDIRVDPEKKLVSGKNTIRFKMLKDDTRIQLDLYANLNVDKILLGTTPLKYERELNAVFIDFPETLRAGREYAIDFHYSGTPQQQGRFGGFVFQQGAAGRHVDLHGVRRRGLEHLVAEQGSVARRAGEHGHQRRGPERPDRRVERQASWARPTWATASRAGTGACTTRSTPTTSRSTSPTTSTSPTSSAISTLDFYVTPAESREGQGAVRAGQADDRGVPEVLRRVSRSRRTATS